MQMESESRRVIAAYCLITVQCVRPGYNYCAGQVCRGFVRFEGIMKEKVVKTDEEWRAQLTPEQYKITRQKGTEPPFTNKYWMETKKGVYRCVACGQTLFRSEDKFECGCGWPSFSAPIDQEAVETAPDLDHGMTRTEVKCSRCDAHLGHLFDDGPPPTFARYCIDSEALELVEEVECSEKSECKR